MTKIRLTILISVLLLLAGCASIPTGDIKVEAQADPKVNFSGYKTYDWLGAAAIVNDPYGQWEPPAFDADAEMVLLIDRELRKRGMSQRAVNPDMVVAYAAGIDMAALDLKVDPNSQIEPVENVPQGGLAVVLMDNASGFVIWAGIATAEVQDSPDTATVRARLDYAVTQLFRKLP
ncbi:MAG: DUF4136 domain-containing protein [Desulfosarcinaceae bacterium]|nr:DUF4136 domain-containing protein [Desulfosarcinaceae bacterium]